jgi:hypothetical protein
MKKLILALTTVISFSVFAQDVFNKTSWQPFVDTNPVEFATSITITYSSFKDKQNRFVHKFEGFARYKIQKEYVYQLFVIDCENHIVSLWTQDQQHIRSEYINPAHPIWWYRNTGCKKG